MVKGQKTRMMLPAIKDATQRQKIIIMLRLFLRSNNTGAKKHETVMLTIALSKERNDIDIDIV